jgi:energy-coupling factor transporter transmembrane protein EcfT
VPVPDKLEVPSKFKFVIVVCVAPKLIVSAPSVIFGFAKLAFEIAAVPDKFALTIFEMVLLLALIVLFVNSCVPVKVATVLSMLKVTSFEPTTEVIPVPPVSLKLSPNETLSVVDVSSINVIDEFVKEELPIFDNVLFEPLIVLFVNISVEVSVTIEPSVDQR